LLSLQEEYTPKKKRGNPNFGKDNPYLNKTEDNE